MIFSFTEEHAQLRTALRRFLQDKSPSAEVRRLMQTEDGYDPLVWNLMAGQLGLQGLAIPEKFGGSGYGPVEQAIVLEEMGRALLCAPYFGTAVLAARALLVSGDEGAQEQFLPGIADGSTIAALAVPEDDGHWTTAGLRTRAGLSGGDYVLDGRKSFVLDGHIADLVLITARTPSGPSLFAVQAGADGLTRLPLAAVDMTRKLARLDLNAVPARLVGADGGAAEIIERTLQVAVAGLAAEQVGGAQRCLDMSVDYAKMRMQFGRPIGSSRPSSTCAPTCCSRWSPPDLLLTMQPGRRRSSPASFRWSPAWPRHIVPRRTSTRLPTTSRSTAGSASPGNTTHTCITGGLSPPS